MKRFYHIALVFSFLTLAFFKSSGQTNSIELKSGSGSLISTHSSITDALTAIPSSVSQAYIIEMTSTYTGSSETFPINFVARTGASATNTITLRPATGVTTMNVTASVGTNGLIFLDNADYVIIDGRPGGTGITKALTLNNSSTAASATILFQNGACNNIVRYCNLIHASTSSAGRCIAFNTSASTTSGNSDNLVSNVKMTGGRYCVQMAGTVANPNSRNTLYGCELLNPVYAAIYHSGSGNSNVTIDSSSFYCTSATGGGVAAMYFLSIGDTLTITRNRIYDMMNSSSTSYIYGIYLSPSAGALMRVNNNFVALGTNSNNTGSTSIHGIYFSSSTVADAEIYYNSVHIGGTLSSGGTSGSVVSSCIYKTAGAATSNYRIKNNILVNDRTGGTSGVQHVGLGFTNVTGVYDMDYNTYNVATGTISRWVSALNNTITDHQAAVPSGNEANANDQPVNFVSATDLHVTGSSLGDFNLKATPISYINKDIDNNPRGGTTYRGADDNNANPITSKKNDIGVISVDEPLTGTCASPATVKVTVKNFGGNQVDTFKVNWSINGVVQTPITSYLLLDTLYGSGSQTAQLTLGTFNVSSGTLYTIKTWTSGPNTLTDPDKTNDTAIKLYKMALPGGTYTVGGTTPDFATLAEVADYLNNYGICGPVVFNLRSGTYNEKLNLGEIGGSSTTNTVTFQSDIKDSTAVVISSPASTATTDNYTIQLNGTDNITFKLLTAERSGTGTNSTVVSLAGLVENVKITNCILRGPTNTSSDASGVRSNVFGASTASTRNLEVAYSILDNNSNGLWLNTDTSKYANYSRGTKIHHNIIKSHYTGIFPAGQIGLQIYNNTITRYDMTVNSDYYGISMNVVDSAFYVANNKIDMNRTYGIRLRKCAGSSGSEGQVINNMITANYTGTVSVYGLSIETQEANILFAHNTVLMNVDYTSTTANTGARALYAPTTTTGIASNLRILNNILYSNIDGVSFYMTSQALAGVTQLDYNLYYSGDANLTYTGAYQADLASFQLATGKAAHGYNGTATFVSNNDAHIVQMQKFFFGRNDLNITTDIDGNPRCASLPTVGADEYVSTGGMPQAEFVGPDSIFTGDRSYFLFKGNSNQVAVYHWYVNGVQVGQSLNLTYTFATSGTYTVRQIAENCSGLDTFEKTYTVVAPTSVPVPDFTVDRNQLYKNESVKFTDLSQKGPTSWGWHIMPENGVIISDSNAQDPTVLFTESGKYQVCLTAGNAKGKSTQLCRTAYIDVAPVVSMCGESISTYERGKVYDDGGSGADYTANANCSFYINTCASSVTLKFKDWTVTDVDDSLTMYDGDTSSPANIIATIYGGMTNPGGSIGYTAKTGKMWLVWHTDAATQAVGFEAVWTSIPASVTPVKAAFSIPDTAYTNSPVNITNTSAGSGLMYNWDFDHPNLMSDDKGSFINTNPKVTYTTTGVHTIMLVTTACSGSDTVKKTIVVVNPTKKPSPDFTATLTRLNVTEVTQLLDKSSNGPSSWKWQVTPSTGVGFIDPATSQNPRISFTNAGIYTVSLIATNSIGTDSVIKTSFIEVLNYCSPNVSSTLADIGIRRVVIDGIDQSSDFGVKKYNDFTQNKQAAQLYEATNHTITIERNSNNEKVNIAAWIDFNQDGDFDDSNERVLNESNSGVQILTASIAIPPVSISGFTRMRVGLARPGFPLDPCGPVLTGEYEDYKVYINFDKTAPVIMIIGANPDSVEVGYGYTDKGALATDNLDGSLTPGISMSSTVDTLVEGVYTVTYTVTDSRGNTTTVQRKVVVTKDVTAPILTMFGADTIHLEVFDSYTEPGYDAVDNPFGAGYTNFVTVDGYVDTANTGTYVLTYRVKDFAGNFATPKTRVVIVSDTQAPVLTLNGDDVVEIQVKTAYAEKGATVTDNSKKALTYTITGTVNENVIGTYELFYNVSDLSGNAATTVKRTVNVVDKIAPVIMLVGNEIIHLSRWEDYGDSGYVVSDNYYDSTDLTIDTLGDWVTSSLEGLYYIQYRATDPSGNTTLSQKRVIDVRGLNSISDVIKNTTLVYPNPSNGQFTIENSNGFDANTAIIVTNTLGQKVYETKGSGDVKIAVNLEGASAGVYFVRVSAGNKTEVTKITIR